MSGEITWGCLTQPALFRGSLGNTKTQPARVSLILGDALTRFLALPRASVHKPDWSILSIRYGMSWGLGWGLGNKQKCVGGAERWLSTPWEHLPRWVEGVGAQQGDEPFRRSHQLLSISRCWHFKLWADFYLWYFLVASCGTVTLFISIRGW